MIDSEPKFLQGIYPFTGAGFAQPVDLAGLTISADKRAQLIYLRAGNSSDEMVCLQLSRDGALMRLFPVGAKSAAHVQLALVEDIAPDSKLSLAVAAPPGVTGVIVLDLGLVEI